MAALVQSELIDELRRLIDQVTLSGEDAATDADMEDLASSMFSDTDLGERLDDAARFVAARVEARHLPDLVETVGHRLIHNQKILRFIGTRVFLGSATNTRRTFTGHRKLYANGVPVSTSNPIVVLEDMDVLPLPLTAINSHSFAYVRVPDDVTDLTDPLRDAVVARALLVCATSLGSTAGLEIAQSNLTQAIGPFLMPAFRQQPAA